MENQSLLLTLSVGVVCSFALFFVLYKVFRLSSKLAALITILVVEAVYIPLAAWQWAGLDVFAIHFAFFTMVPYGLAMITSQRDTQRRYDAKHGQAAVAAKPWFHWAPATIIVFFVIIATVDATIITLANKGASAEFMQRFLPEPRMGQGAVSVFPGVVSHDFKEKYDQFNHYMAQLKEQGERGWQVSEGWQTKPLVGQDAVFKIKLTDKAGQPLSQGKASVWLLRPANQSLDRQFELMESAPGYYAATINVPQAGLWKLVIRIEQAGKRHEVRGDTWITPAS